jgi:hypothetical protein
VEMTRKSPYGPSQCIGIVCPILSPPGRSPEYDVFLSYVSISMVIKHVYAV